MDDEAKVAQVRRFNRTVTQHVGALNEQYLGSKLSLGEARVLWEIAPKGTDLRSLRVTLGLDSGYLSRLINRLTGAGLVTLHHDRYDGRTRFVRLTRMGRAQKKVLDGRSDALAVSLLDPLSPQEREELVDRDGSHRARHDAHVGHGLASGSRGSRGPGVHPRVFHGAQQTLRYRLRPVSIDERG